MAGIALICPACHSGRLTGPEEHFYRCHSEDCGAKYPVIDGVPILVPGWVDYARSERWMILRRRDLPVQIDAMLDEPLGDEHAERIRARHLETYRRSHFGEPAPELAEISRALFHWVRRNLPANACSGLDAGCATGGFTKLLSEHVDAAVGIDLHFERVRVASEMVGSASFFVANAEEPPFEEASFDVVLALNLIDGIRRPRLALHSLAERVVHGGLLLLTTPFDYSTIYSDRQEWIGETELMDLLTDAFDIVDDVPRLPWVLPASRRHSDIFFVRAIAARKK